MYDPDRRTIACTRCGGHVTMPSLKRDVGAEVQRLSRDGKVMDALRQLRDAAGMSLGDAKSYYLHLVREPGVCHRCFRPHPPVDVGPCPHCGCVNIDPGAAPRQEHGHRDES